MPGMRSVAKVESRRELLEGSGGDRLLAAGRRQAPRGAQPLGRREWAALGDGHGVPRRRVPHTEPHAPANFATIHMASNLLRRGKGKHSMTRQSSTSLVGMRTFSTHCSPPE